MSVRIARVCAACAVAFWAGACATLPQAGSAGAPPARRPHVVRDPSTLHVDPVKLEEGQLFAFVDGHTGQSLSFDDVLARARQSEVVVLGEQHDAPLHHELQRRVVAALGSSDVRIGLEMVDVTQQPVLDRFDRGALPMDALPQALDWQKSWGFPFELYRPVFLDGHASGARFVALNVPRALVRAVRQRGVRGLRAEELRLLPDLDLGDELHRAWFRELMTNAQHPMAARDVDAFYTAQVVWDEAMAARAVAALQQGARQVLVLAGVGHVARGRGIPQRVERRRPQTRVLSVVPVAARQADALELALRDAIAAGEGDVLVVMLFEEELDL